jgi:LuxR family maltose regulon positive regulatory protein
MEAPLLQTKLYIPAFRGELVSRSRLIERLSAGLHRKLTLVSAPAGFGKTTCVAEWVNALDWPVAWLSLDPADDDPGRFFVYLLATLQRVDASLGQEIEGVLRSGQLPSGEIISTTLTNNILAWNSRFLLVLDDFQVIQDPFILQVLERWLASLPQPMHLVLITREDPPLPLARLRAHNQLTEIRARDLRFTRQDAERFLNEVLGLSLSRADITSLHDKTEGWVAGLQLVAVAVQSSLPVRDRADLSSFVATLSGSHRFILSYLTEEVLSQQPEEIRQFLLQTSILDRLNGDLCNAVTGRVDGQVMLERLLNANLFLIPLDDEARWYRYHHLFSDSLQDLLHSVQKDGMAELHRRASHWYAGENMASEAIQHALAAEDYAMAVDLLERHALSMIMQGYAKTVNGWVQAMPPEWASSSPRTNLAFAWMHLLRGAYSEASPYLERAKAAFDSQVESNLGVKERSIKAEWLVMQSLLQNMHGKMTESLALAIQALEIAPEDDSRVRSLAYFGQAYAYQVMEDYGLVVDTYRMAIQHARAANNLIAEMLSTSGLAQLALEHGQLHLAFEIAAPVWERLEQSGAPPPISTVVYGMLGEVCIQWLQVERARHYILRALQLSTLGGYNSGMINCRVLLSRLSQLEGDLEDAAHEIQGAVDLLQVDTPEYVRQEAVSQQVRVYLAHDRLAAAEMALQGEGFSFRDGFSFAALPPAQSISHSIGLVYNSSLDVLLYRARTRGELTGLTPGIELAGCLIDGALQSQTLLVALEALLLRAQMRDALENNQPKLAAHLADSRADYLAALELAEPEGILGVFVQQGSPVAEALADMMEQNKLGTIQAGYVERIVAAFYGFQSPGERHGQQPAPDLPVESRAAISTEPLALIEPLTDREREVLGLMARGLKYKEIAARLFISLNTVRFHVKAIYGKLNANNRTTAVERARQLRIL